MLLAGVLPLLKERLSTMEPAEQSNRNWSGADHQIGILNSTIWLYLTSHQSFHREMIPSFIKSVSPEFLLLAQFTTSYLSIQKGILTCINFFLFPFVSAFSWSVFPAITTWKKATAMDTKRIKIKSNSAVLELSKQ